MAYDKYGGVPGTHQTGPIVSEYGFRTGDKWGNHEVIDDKGTLFPIIIGRAAASLEKGDLVYISGWNASDELPVMTKAKADEAHTSAQFVAVEDADSGDPVKVSGYAMITGIDTDSETANEPVYLSIGTAGEWQDAAPSGNDEVVQPVGTCLASDASDGAILFYPMYGKAMMVAFV